MAKEEKMHVVADFFAEKNDVEGLVKDLKKLKKKLKDDDKELIEDTIDVLNDILGGDIYPD